LWVLMWLRPHWRSRGRRPRFVGSMPSSSWLTRSSWVSHVGPDTRRRPHPISPRELTAAFNRGNGWTITAIGPDRTKNQVRRGRRSGLVGEDQTDLDTGTPPVRKISDGRLVLGPSCVAAGGRRGEHPESTRALARSLELKTSRVATAALGYERGRWLVSWPRTRGPVSARPPLRRQSPWSLLSIPLVKPAGNRHRGRTPGRPGAGRKPPQAGAPPA
jgi:hypothetical protein